jgi:hypothetical protein
LAALSRAEALAGPLGPYTLQAEIAACHARARTAEQTDWPRIVALYDALAQMRPTPIVELDRAVAVSMAYGPAAGLELVDAITSEPAMSRYHLLPAVRGDLLAKLGRTEEARAELERAAELTANERERAAAVASGGAGRRTGRDAGQRAVVERDPRRCPQPVAAARSPSAISAMATRRLSAADRTAASMTRCTSQPSRKDGTAACPVAMAVTKPRAMWSRARNVSL